jgi:hypothetical protein
VSERIEHLRKTVEKAFHCQARHAGSQRVSETFMDKLVWDGVVETFDIAGHPKAKRCYAFQFAENDKILIKTVLEIPPVTSPQSAVKVAIAAKGKK